MREGCENQAKQAARETLKPQTLKPNPEDKTTAGCRVPV